MDFGNFVSKNCSKFIQIGNFVSKFRVFEPFLVLAKNLTKWSRPNESSRDGRTLSRRRESLRKTNNNQNN